MQWVPIEQRNDMDEILPGLWLGSKFSADNYEFLKEQGITSILTLISTPHDPPPKAYFKHLAISIEDEDSSDILKHF